MKRILFLLLLLSVEFHASATQHPIRVACVGNSITFGTGIADRAQNAYPVQLQRMLGDRYEVRNFGKPGATLLKHGHRPYTAQKEYSDALDFRADLVVIHLGINDTDPRNWPNYGDEFTKDYCDLIASFRKANPSVRIIIARMTPISDRHPRFESGTRDWHDKIQQAIEQVAFTQQIQLIDFYEPLLRYPHLLKDGIHPNDEGAKILAKTVYQGITGDFGGLSMPEIYSDRMVLQHGQKLEISGQANYNDPISVKINGRTYRTKTPRNGRWTVEIDPLKAGNGYTLEIATKEQKLCYKDVAAGVVWLCSGQSNMAFPLRSCHTARQTLANANNSDLRLYHMKPRWETNAREWDETALDSINRLQYYNPTSWETSRSETAKDFSAIAYYFGSMLQDSLRIPVGIICNAVGGATTESWIDRRTLEHEFPAILRTWSTNDFIQAWVRGRGALNIKKSNDALQRHPYQPCYLYEAGILPLKGYMIDGVIWYQGESNAHNMEAHEKLFNLLVESWRETWHNETLPFYFVQLSSLNRPSWPRFRDSQRRLAQQIEHTAMIVSSDKGDSLDVHPIFKYEIGERLVRQALYHKYAFEHLIPSGPIYKSYEIKGQRVSISFEYAEGLHSSDNEALRCFEIAGKDGIYYPANAQIEGNKIVVWAKEVTQPIGVRYAWQPFTRANLVNAAELPASTFITND